MTVQAPASGASRTLLVVAAIVTIVLWQIPPYGNLALYPFTLLATYAHEMGHGLTAVLVGGEFEWLKIFPDGSGLASWRGDVGRVGRAMVAAGGLVGPSVAGAAILALSRSPRRARFVLWVIGGAMLATALIAGSTFTLGFVLAVGALTLLFARNASPAWTSFGAQLVGVQLCVALFHDVRYMFSAGGVVGGQAHGSDSAAMAEALLLPYWFWGGLTAAFSGSVLVLGLWLALRDDRKRQTEPSTA